MKVNAISLENIGCFNQLDLPLATKESDGTNVTVLVGSNGAGKTTILESLDLALTWFVARLKREQGNGRHISEKSINNSHQHGLAAKWEA